MVVEYKDSDGSPISGSITTRSRDLCYPEGNFGRNQLLDGSIGLSPLCQDVTIDLHVRTVTGFHQRFLLASPSPGIVHHLSGLSPDAHSPERGTLN